MGLYIDFPLKSPVITNSHGHKLLHDSGLPFRPQLVDTLVTSFSFDVLPWDSQDESIDSGKKRSPTLPLGSLGTV